MQGTALVNSIQNYYFCNKCNNIESESKWAKSPSKSYICNQCDACDKKEDWPPKEIEAMLNFILTYDNDKSEYGQITTVFLSSVLELLLEELLYTMAYLDLSYDDAFILVDALIDSHQGRNRMFSLYKRIGYGSFRNDVNELGFPNFCGQWDEIVKVRNQVVHGKFEAGKNIESNTIKTTIVDALEVFSQLHNLYNKETIKYKYSVKRKKGIESDIEKLNKWSDSASQDPPIIESDKDKSQDV